MPWAAAAVVGGALIASNATSNAADSQAAGVADANALSKSQYDQTRADQAPWMARGNTAGDRLSYLLGLGTNDGGADFGSLTKQFNGSSLTSDPGYQFGLDQGTRGIQNSASAKGGFYSGATLKALQRFDTDYAGTKYNEAFNRDQATKGTLYNQLAGVSGTGQTATNQVDAAGTNYANTAGNNITSGANASAAASLAQGNILSNALSQGASMWGRANTGSNGVGSGSTWFNDPTDVSGYNATNGSDAGWYPSDWRLKTDLQAIGMTERGSTVYVWRWKAGGCGFGVIAQEVAHIPGAVAVGPDGFLMVNYDKV